MAQNAESSADEAQAREANNETANALNTYNLTAAMSKRGPKQEPAVQAKGFAMPITAALPRNLG